MQIYVASSWRNPSQPSIVLALRKAGHEVYDFRHPGVQGPHAGDDVGGFAWSDIDPDWQSWSAETFKVALVHPVAALGFSRDLAAMQWADAFVLVHPSGRSAHLEAGWATGAGKPCAVLLEPQGEPELMLKLVEPDGRVCVCPEEVLVWAREVDHQVAENEALLVRAMAMSEEDVDAELRAAGEDPAKVGHAGTVFVRAVLERREALEEQQRLQLVNQVLLHLARKGPTREALEVRVVDLGWRVVLASWGYTGAWSATRYEVALDGTLWPMGSGIGLHTRAEAERAALAGLPKREG